MLSYRILVWTHCRRDPYKSIRPIAEQDIEIVYSDNLLQYCKNYKAAFRALSVQCSRATVKL